MSPKSWPDPRPCPARRGRVLPTPSLRGGPGLGGMGQQLLKVGDPEWAAVDWVFCCRPRYHGSAKLRAGNARRAGPGAVRAVVARWDGHRVARGGPGTRGPGTRDPGAGECPGVSGAPGVTLYCQFFQIQR